MGKHRLPDLIYAHHFLTVIWAARKRFEKFYLIIRNNSEYHSCWIIYEKKSRFHEAFGPDWIFINE